MLPGQQQVKGISELYNIKYIMFLKLQRMFENIQCIIKNDKNFVKLL